MILEDFSNLNHSMILWIELKCVLDPLAMQLEWAGGVFVSISTLILRRAGCPCVTVAWCWNLALRCPGNPRLEGVADPTLLLQRSPDSTPKAAKGPGSCSSCSWEDKPLISSGASTAHPPATHSTEIGSPAATPHFRFYMRLKWRCSSRTSPASAFTTCFTSCCLFMKAGVSIRHNNDDNNNRTLHFPNNHPSAALKLLANL